MPFGWCSYSSRAPLASSRYLSQPREQVAISRLPLGNPESHCHMGADMPTRLPARCEIREILFWCKVLQFRLGQRMWVMVSPVVSDTQR